MRYIPTGRGATLITALALVCMLLVPVGSGSVRAARTAAINHDASTLIIGEQYLPTQTMDPIVTFFLSWGMIASNVFDALVYRGDDLKIHKDMGLATDWKYLDQNTLRFTLRKGVTFQDGEPFNADAVKFTFDRLLGPLGQKGAQYFQYKAIKEVKVIDPYTVDFITKAPDPVLVTKLAGYGAMIVPPVYIKKHGDTYFGTHPIGTGPFMMTKYDPSTEADLVRYDKYWRGPAKMAKVIYRFIPNQVTNLAELQTGHIDILQNAAIAQASVLKSDSNLHVYPVGSTTVTAIFLNGRVSPTNNVAVRQAINYAIDTKSIIKDILNGYGKQVATFQTTASFGNDPSLKPYPYDPAKAKALLASAHLSGTPSLTFEVDGTDTTFKQVAEVVVAELQQVGIKVDLKPVSTQILYVNNWPKGTFGNMTEFGWGGWTLDFDNTAYSLYHTGEYYNPGYSNPTLDSILVAARSTLDQNKRLALYKQADAILYHDVPNVVVYQNENIWAASTHVHNFVAPPDDRLELHDVTLQ